MTELNTDALVAPVGRLVVRTFYRRFSAQNASVRKKYTLVRRIAAVIGVIAGVIGVAALGFGMTEELREGAPDAGSEIVGMVIIASLLAFTFLILAHYYVRATRRRGTPRRHYRLAAFAAANGMTYLPGPYTGNHLTPWLERGGLVVSRVMRPTRGRWVEFANFELATGASGQQSKVLGGYCAVRLTTALPHILLRASGNPLSEWTMQSFPARPQRLSLEGDFDRHFALHCPAGYERDALYLFTPDVMARVIDSVDGFDIEIVDDWLFLVSASDVVTLDPAVWAGLATAMTALTEKIDRWERWREDRPVDASFTPAFSQVSNPVASPGRRLRMTLGRGNLLWMLFGIASLLAIILASVFR